MRGDARVDDRDAGRDRSQTVAGALAAHIGFDPIDPGRHTVRGVTDTVVLDERDTRIRLKGADESFGHMRGVSPQRGTVHVRDGGPEALRMLGRGRVRIEVIAENDDDRACGVGCDSGLRGDERNDERDCGHDDEKTHEPSRASARILVRDVRSVEKIPIARLIVKRADTRR